MKTTRKRPFPELTLADRRFFIQFELEWIEELRAARAEFSANLLGHREADSPDPIEVARVEAEIDAIDDELNEVRGHLVEHSAALLLALDDRLAGCSSWPL